MRAMGVEVVASCRATLRSSCHCRIASLVNSVPLLLTAMQGQPRSSAIRPTRRRRACSTVPYRRQPPNVQDAALTVAGQAVGHRAVEAPLVRTTTARVQTSALVCSLRVGIGALVPEERFRPVHLRTDRSSSLQTRYSLFRFTDQPSRRSRRCGRRWPKRRRCDDGSFGRDSDSASSDRVGSGRSLPKRRPAAAGIPVS